MSRRISSHWTTFAPYLTVVIYAPVIAFLVITYDVSSVLWWLMVCSFVIGNIVALALCPFPKIVDLDNDTITITSPIRHYTFSLPLKDIAEVRPAWFTQHVSLILNVDTPLGRKITFIPRMKLFHPLLGHPDIQELKDAITNSKSAVAS